MPKTELSQEDSGTAKRTMKNLVRFLMASLFVLFVVVSTVSMVGLQPNSSDPFSVDLIISIPKGASGWDISRVLMDNGIVKDAHFFAGLIRLTGTDSRLQAGDYLLNPTMSPLQIIDKLNQGQVYTQRVVIPEGFEIKQIASLLANHDLVDRERFIMLAHDASLVYGDIYPIDLPIRSLEGYLFPDTYGFVKGQTEEAIIRQMVSRFIAVVPELIEGMVLPDDFTLHQILTLASIVEKEVMVNRERPIVASVYLNRLAIDMPLQADPTVRYVMTEKRSQVLYRDLDIQSPYNTYRNRGLPPGPIASPGVRSILAVLKPADTDYFFFVSQRNGTHRFTRTFEQHVQARRELGY